jgi:hypothetical protein
MNESGTIHIDDQQCVVRHIALLTGERVAIARWDVLRCLNVNAMADEGMVDLTPFASL